MTPSELVAAAIRPHPRQHRTYVRECLRRLFQILGEWLDKLAREILTGAVAPAILRLVECPAQVL